MDMKSKYRYQKYRNGSLKNIAVCNNNACKWHTPLNMSCLTTAGSASLPSELNIELHVLLSSGRSLALRGTSGKYTWEYQYSIVFVSDRQKPIQNGLKKQPLMAIFDSYYKLRCLYLIHTRTAPEIYCSYTIAIHTKYAYEHRATRVKLCLLSFFTFKLSLTNNNACNVVQRSPYWSCSACTGLQVIEKRKE